MFDPTQIKSIFDGVIGWEQNINPDGVQLAAGLIASSSGIKYNSFHPLLTFNNLYSIAPDFEAIHGDINTPANKVLVEAAFSAWLTEQTQSATLRAFDLWTGTKLKNKTTRNLLERTQLYDLGSIGGEVETATDKTQGIEIIPRTSRGLIYPIKKIGVQLEQANSFNIYLFHSSESAPVKTEAIVYTTAGAVQWFNVDWKLSKGSGSYYIGYNINDLTGGVINGTDAYNSSGTIKNYPMGRYFSASPFSVAGDNTTMWDTNGNIYTTDTNHGLNLQISAVCDFSEFIIEQKDIFRQLVGVQLATDLLRQMAYNPETKVNRHQTNIDRASVLYEIDGDSQGREGGLKQQLETILDGLQLDTNGIDKICLPCKRRGQKFKAI